MHRRIEELVDLGNYYSMFLQRPDMHVRLGFVIHELRNIKTKLVIGCKLYEMVEEYISVYTNNYDIGVEIQLEKNRKGEIIS